MKKKFYLLSLLLVVFICGGCFRTKTVQVTNKVDDSYKDIKADDLVVAIYNRTTANTITGIDNTLYNTKKLSVDDMTDEYKGLIAEKNYASYISDYGYTVSEDSVRYAYDSIFGAGTYKTGQKIYSNCFNFTYNNAGYYEDKQGGGCGGTTASDVYPLIIKAEKNNKYLKVTAAYVFRNKENLYKSYSDLENTSNTLGTLKTLIGENYKNTVEYSSNDKIFDYVKKNQDSLEQYTKTFEIDDNGFYKYVGFERTKD